MIAPRPDEHRGVYGISVAAELAGMGVQNLRLYEARGLLEPRPHRGRHPPLQRRTTSIGCAASANCWRPASISPESAWCWTCRTKTVNSARANASTVSPA